jgi:hypothetical protein
VVVLLLGLFGVSTFTTTRAAAATSPPTPSPGGVSLKAQYKVNDSSATDNWRSEVLAVPDRAPCLPATPTVTPTPVSSLPDLQVRGSGISADVSCPPGPVYVRVVVSNAGNTSPGPFVVQVNSETQTVAGLGPREWIGLKFIAVMSEYSPNNIYADPTNQVVESDETNNFSRYEPRYPTRVYCPPTPTGTPTPTLTPTLTPITSTAPGNLPDLAIAQMEISSEINSCPQRPLGLLVYVANTGTADAGRFVVSANGDSQTAADNRLINADENGAYNIIRKAIPNA